MAPEILRGEPYTRAADVYSFGVILWELCNGEIPHKGRSLQQIVGSVGVNGHKLKMPAPVENGNRAYNPFFQHIVQVCTQHDALVRPTFQDVLNYLDRFQIQSNN